MADNIDIIPKDIYVSDDEMVVVVPLWGVKKDSLDIVLEDDKLIISGYRQKPVLKDNLVLSLEECYWWDFSLQIDLPSDVYYDKIYSKLTPENILIIIIPKIRKPKKIKIDIQ